MPVPACPSLRESYLEAEDEDAQLYANIASTIRALEPTPLERAALNPFTPFLRRRQPPIAIPPETYVPSRSCSSNQRHAPACGSLEQVTANKPGQYLCRITPRSNQLRSTPPQQESSKTRRVLCPDIPRTTTQLRPLWDINTPEYTPKSIVAPDSIAKTSAISFSGFSNVTDANIMQVYNVAMHRSKVHNYAATTISDTTSPLFSNTFNDIQSSAQTFDSPELFSLPARTGSDMTSILHQREGYQGTIFRPSRAVIEHRASQTHAAYELQSIRQPRFYANYKGSSGSTGNQAVFLPGSENCALWIENIPKKAGIKDLLGAITNTGKVYSTHITYATGAHTTNAIKLVFFNPRSAQALHARSQSSKGLIVHGARLRVRSNRHAYRCHSRLYESRVVRVIGPKYLVTEKLMCQYIDMMMVASILDIFEIESPAAVFRGMRELEIHFGSLHAQAAAFKSAVELEPAMKDCVRVVFATDPCE